MREQVIKRNNVHVYGHGEPTLLFAHGFGTGQETWRFVAPAFAENNRVVLFDYVGFGHSDPSAYDPDKYSSLEGYATDIVELIRTLDLGKVVHIGHSIGGLVGILAASLAPDAFDRLVLLESSPRYLNDPPDYYGGFERGDVEGLMEMMERNLPGAVDSLSSSALGDAGTPELEQEIENRFFDADPHILRQFARLTFFADYRDALAGTPVPALLLYTQDDNMVPRGIGEYMHESMPNSTLRYMNASGHFPHMSHAQETIRMLRWYVRKSMREPT